MSAGTTVFKKDMRLAASVVVPALGVLAVVLMFLLFGHFIPGIGRTLWGTGGTPPDMIERFATFQPILVGGLYIASVWTAVVVAQGDRVRRAAALALMLPLSDANKIASKLACLAAIAAAFLAVVVLNAWSSSGLPQEWSSFLLLIGVAPFFGALCGLAATSLVRNVTAAVLLGLAMPLLGVMLSWLAATAFARVDVNDPAIAFDLPHGRIAVAWESAFLPASILSGTTWTLLAAVMGFRVLSGRTPKWNLWIRVGGPVLVAMTVAAITAAVVVERDTAIPALRLSVIDREAAALEADQLDDRTLLMKGLGLGVETQVGGSRRDSAVVGECLGRAVYWRELGLTLAPTPNEWGIGSDRWLGESQFVRIPFAEELTRRRATLGVDLDSPNELMRAVRRLAIDRNATQSVLVCIYLAKRTSYGQRVPDLAAVLLSAQDEFERALAILAIASIGRDDDESQLSRSARLDWCEALMRARSTLESALPGGAPSSISRPDANRRVFPEDEPLIHQAIALLSQPLPAVADFLEERERNYDANAKLAVPRTALEAEVKDAPAWRWRFQLHPNTLDCLRKGL